MCARRLPSPDAYGYRMSGHKLPCHCFSLCNPIEASYFYANLPDKIVDADSPWVGYLEAVYLQKPQLPITNLHELHYWYHHDPLVWPRGVEWPMAMCQKKKHANTTLMDSDNSSTPGAVWVAAPESTRCEAAYCDRWRAQGQAADQRRAQLAQRVASGTATRLAMEEFVIYVVLTKLHVSRGTLLSHVPRNTARSRLRDSRHEEMKKRLHATVLNATAQRSQELVRQSGWSSSPSASPSSDGQELIRQSELDAIVAVFNDTLGRAVYPSGSWVEVVRHDDRLVKTHASKQFEGVVPDCERYPRFTSRHPTPPLSSSTS